MPVLDLPFHWECYQRFAATAREDPSKQPAFPRCHSCAEPVAAPFYWNVSEPPFCIRRPWHRACLQSEEQRLGREPGPPNPHDDKRLKMLVAGIQAVLAAPHRALPVWEPNVVNKDWVYRQFVLARYRCTEAQAAQLLNLVRYWDIDAACPAGLYHMSNGLLLVDPAAEPLLDQLAAEVGLHPGEPDEPRSQTIR